FYFHKSATELIQHFMGDTSETCTRNEFIKQLANDSWVNEMLSGGLLPECLGFIPPSAPLIKIPNLKTTSPAFESKSPITAKFRSPTSPLPQTSSINSLSSPTSKLPISMLPKIEIPSKKLE
ncbi:hypothetical protein HK096_009683, partial [Nowakowskiella sp. JEL0078]